MLFILRHSSMVAICKWLFGEDDRWKSDKNEMFAMNVVED
jgi:hypothetical protein